MFAKMKGHVAIASIPQCLVWDCKGVKKLHTAFAEPQQCQWISDLG